MRAPRSILWTRWASCIVAITVAGFIALPIPYWKRNAIRLRERLDRRATGGERP